MLKFYPRMYQLYLAANVITPFLVSAFFFVAFLMTFELFRILQIMSSDEVSVSFLAGMLGDVAITLVPMAIPLSIYFAIIYTLGKLSGDSEYVALRAAGLEKRKILAPLLFVAFLVAVNVHFLSQELVPGAHARVRKKIKIVSSASLIQGIKGGQFFTSLPNITMFPAQMNEQTLELKKVFLHIFEPQDSIEKVIHANEGRILHEKDEGQGLETLKLLLKDGNIASYNLENENVEKILFKEYTLPISEQRFSYNPSTKEIMMDRKELTSFIDAGLDQALLRDFSKKDYMNAKYEYWNRINTPVLCILLAFLGFGLGVTGNRTKSKNSSGKAILFLIGYYVIFFSLVNLARAGTIPSWLAMLIPGLVLLFVGIFYYRKVDWV